MTLTSTNALPSDPEPFPVSIEIDAAKPGDDLVPIWRFFGADEPNYATMKHGRKLLGELGKLDPKQVYFRAHNLLTSGDGTPSLKWGSTGVYGEDGRGRPIYDWTILDGIFDAYLQNDVRPYVQIGFMPEALSIKPHPYRHRWTPHANYEDIYTGWAYPPKDYGKWGELVYQWVRHAIEKYGREEVGTWYWQTWNEPNIGYWQGTRDEFFALHDYAIDAVRRANPTARVGGPDLAGGAGGDYLESFLNHCLREKNHATGKTGTPLDFISFHAKGAPKFVEGHVRMGIANQLRDIDRAFEVIAGYPELKKTPIIIGESDPEGCAACQGPELAYRNGAMYSSYTAASFARKHDLAARHGVYLEGALTWAFEFEDKPWFAGYRSLATNGVDKPVLNVFRMFARMQGQRLPVRSDYAVPLDDILKDGVRQKPDISAMAARDGGRTSIMVWHYHDDDLPGPPAEVTLTLNGLPETARSVRHFRVDDSHGNAYARWLAMDSPQQPTPEQIKTLEEASKLAELPAPELQRDGDKVSLQVSLPRRAVSLLVIGE